MKKRIEDAVEFIDKIQENPIYFLEDNINSSSTFAILKTTQNGKYMRGNLLYYSMNGVEIYTDSNNIIFVDAINHTLFVREYEKVEREINPQDPEEKQYILLYVDLTEEDDEGEVPLRWEAVQGRNHAYESIKANAPVIDTDKSLVLVETVPYKDSLSVRQFVKYLQNSDMVDKYDGFDIDTYGDGEYL